MTKLAAINVDLDSGTITASIDCPEGNYPVGGREFNRTAGFLLGELIAELANHDDLDFDGVGPLKCAGGVCSLTMNLFIP